MIRKTLLFTLLLIVCIHNKAQETAMAYDGTILNKGDIITVGYHTNTASYYTNIKDKIITEYGREQYQYIKDDIKYHELTITDFITPDKAIVFTNTNTIAIAQDSSGKEFYIDIDKAIETGEIISRPAKTIYEDATFLSDDLLMACVIRVNNIEVNDNVFLSFLATQDKELQRRSLSDEFELNKAKQQYMPVLTRMMDEFDFDKIYFIRTGFEMGKYDFDAGGYQMNLFPQYENLLPYGQHYNFIIDKDRDKFRILPVSTEEGESINKRRKGTGRYGYISPTAYGKFYFRLLDKRMDLPKNSMLNMEKLLRHKVVGADLLGVEVYDYPHCEYNFIGNIE